MGRPANRAVHSSRTVVELQTSAFDLFDRMIEARSPVAA
jgi:hypothetical protein